METKNFPRRLRLLLLLALYIEGLSQSFIASSLYHILQYLMSFSPALKHKKYISVYLANRSSSCVTASYKLSLRNQNSNDDVDLFHSIGVKVFEGIQSLVTTDISQ